MFIALQWAVGAEDPFGIVGGGRGTGDHYLGHPFHDGGHLS